MQIKTTDNTRPTPFATLLFVLGTAALLAAAAPALADAKGGLQPAGKPKDRQPIVAHASILPPDPCAAGASEYDCNQNGINDLCDIADGWADANEDGILDHCQFAAGDLDLDGVVGATDLVLVLNDWGTEGHDANGDGIVDGFDLAAILSNWTL
ncbi:MAG: hypothetical protein ACK5WD_06970 [bacterium]